MHAVSSRGRFLFDERRGISCRQQPDVSVFWRRADRAFVQDVTASCLTSPEVVLCVNRMDGIVTGVGTQEESSDGQCSFHGSFRLMCTS